jgi:hypothetical protein
MCVLLNPWVMAAGVHTMKQLPRAINAQKNLRLRSGPQCVLWGCDSAAAGPPHAVTPPWQGQLRPGLVSWCLCRARGPVSRFVCRIPGGSHAWERLANSIRQPGRLAAAAGCHPWLALPRSCTPTLSCGIGPACLPPGCRWQQQRRLFGSARRLSSIRQHIHMDLNQRQALLVSLLGVRRCAALPPRCCWRGVLLATQGPMCGPSGCD